MSAGFPDEHGRKEMSLRSERSRKAWPLPGRPRRPWRPYLPRWLPLLSLLPLPPTIAACPAEQLAKPISPLDDGCWCSLTTAAGSQLWLRCLEHRCVDRTHVECKEGGELVTHGPCEPGQPPAESDAGPDGGREADGGAAGEDAAGCPPGGGRCDRNTFLPCEPGRRGQNCGSNLCVPSGAGPVAGCLAREGQTCRERACAPGLVCDEQHTCRQPESCADRCARAGERSCLYERQPVECQVMPRDGCLGWQSLAPCVDGQRCAEGICRPFCQTAQGRCPRGERCLDRAEGCVADGSGFSPASGFCQTSSDCRTAGAVCLGGTCQPPCNSMDDCLLLGAGGCCAPLRDTGYTICQYTCGG